VLSRAAEITRTKGGTLLQMKLAYNHLTPIFLLLLQWIDFSCTCLLLRYLDLFHIVVYKVSTYSWKVKLYIRLVAQILFGFGTAFYCFFTNDPCFSFVIVVALQLFFFNQRHTTMVDQI